MIDTNKVTLRFLDTDSRMGTLNINARVKPVAISFVSVLQEDGFNYKDQYSCEVANDWNMSNPLTFQAKTVKGLIGQLKRHKYKLVPFRL